MYRLLLFAGFCFPRSFIKVIFHRAAFPPVVRVLVDAGCSAAPTHSYIVEDVLLILLSINIKPNSFLAALHITESRSETDLAAKYMEVVITSVLSYNRLIHTIYGCLGLSSPRRQT